MKPHQVFAFDDFRLDLTSGRLHRGAMEITLRPKAFQLLKYLVENHGRLVSKEELIAVVWADTFVTDDALLKRMKDLRAALDDEARQYIRTVPRRGYIFTAGVTEVADEPVAHVDEAPKAVESPMVEPAPAATRRWSPPLALTLAAVLVVGVLAVAGLIEYRTRRVPVTEATPPIRSIAVLPLKDLTDDPSNEYFSDGMTESLISALARVADLKVSSRGSVMRFKRIDADPGDVGRQLGVAAVLEGSVRKSAGWVRIAVRLVSVADGRVLWARDTQERMLDDIFALQDEIARDVVAELRLNLDASVPQLARKHTDNIEAYQAYLKGRYFWNKRTEAGLQKGIDYFRQAIDADPGYALAYVGLADAYLVLKSLSLITPQEAHEQVEPALKKALALDDTLGEAHASLAWATFAYQWKWDDAEREFQRALALQPNDATTHQWYAEFLSAMGRHDESLAAIQRAQQLEPPSPIINVIAAQVHFFARQYEQAIAQGHKTLELDPDFYIAHDYLGWAYNKEGKYEAALAAVERARAIEDTPLQLCEVGQVHAASGNSQSARAVLRDVIERSSQKQVPRHAYRIARIYAALREPDAAFMWLERAFREREEMLVWLNVDPHVDNLREDPRFDELLRRIGFPRRP